MTTIDEDIALERKIRFWMRATFGSIGLIVIPPLVGLSGTVIGMVNAFHTLGSSGGSDPDRLAGSISISLITTAIGLVLSAIGLIFFVISLIRFLILRRRA